jgi:hypothetical protein
MVRLLAAAAVLSLVGIADSISMAQAQPKSSCSVEKCMAVCTKNGGRTCDLYCRNQMARNGCH